MTTFLAFKTKFALLLQRGQTFLYGLLFLAMGTVTHANASEWEQSSSSGTGRETIVTYSRSVEGMQVKAFRGVTEVPFSVPTVLALFSDTKNLNKWIFNCRNAERLDASKPEAYLQFKGIWPASDRDVLASRQISQLANGDILYETRNVDGHPEQNGYVRIRSLRTSFRLTPMPGEWTKIDFETQIDVGGLIPAWIANIVSLKAPRVTLEGIRRQIQEPQYQNKKLSDVPDDFLKSGTALKLPSDHFKSK